MVSAVRILSVFLCLVPGIFVSKSFVTFKRRTQLDNHICEGISLLFYEEMTWRSNQDCIVQCLKSSECQGVFYGPANRSCFGCSEDVLHGLGIVPADNATEFYLRAEPSTHDQLCSTSTSCDANQYCSDNGFLKTCVCNPGWSFSSTMDRCSRGCIVYGTTYEQHMASILVDGLSQISTNVSFVQCALMCNADPQCRSFNHWVGRSACTLVNSTVLTTAPMHFYHQPNCSHYHRNCV